MKKRAFTLAELSIALLLISALMYGVLYSIGLLKQAKNRAVIQESQDFISAINAFEDKYHSLPGDMYNASVVFGSACAAPCNGNGDGHVTSNETYKAWMHLALANMLSGPYANTPSSSPSIGVNVPGSKYRAGLAWGFGYDGPYNPPSVYGQYLALAAADGSFPSNPGVYPEDAMLIDSKTDDGMPKTGLVMAYGTASSAGCYSQETTSATYNSSVKSYQCVLRVIFRRN